MSAPVRAAAETYSLHCDRCKRDLHETVDEPMQVVIVFKPSLVSMIIPQTHQRERRARCRPCGYVNVFHPTVLTSSWHDISDK